MDKQWELEVENLAYSMRLHEVETENQQLAERQYELEEENQRLRSILQDREEQSSESAERDPKRSRNLVVENHCFALLKFIAYCRSHDLRRK
jgi:hypothetical protein